MTIPTQHALAKRVDANHELVVHVTKRVDRLDEVQAKHERQIEGLTDVIDRLHDALHTALAKVRA